MVSKGEERVLANELKAALGREPTDEEADAVRDARVRFRGMQPNLLEGALKEVAQRQRPSVPNQEPELPIPPPAETNEERQARLRAAADELLENAERSDARSAHDLGEPREWDTRSAERKPARRKIGTANVAPKGIIKK